MLIEGSKIYYRGITTLAERLLISDGLETGLGIDATGYPFREDAVKPKNNWRSLTNDELALVESCRCPYTPSKDIAVLTLPKSTVKALQQSGVTDLRSKDEAIRFCQPTNEGYVKAKGEIERFASQYNAANAPCKHYAFYVEPPNLESVTVNGRREREGLHIDNRSQLSIYQAEYGSNIMLINLGPTSRYFIFINQPAATILNWLGKTSSQSGDYSVYSVTKDFYGAYKDYKAIKLEILPYEAYIAPVEVIIHDGSTQDNQEVNIKYMIGGFYSI